MLLHFIELGLINKLMNVSNIMFLSNNVSEHLTI